MNLDLTGKHALVCGASKGIGLAAAQEIALLGATVTLVARSKDRLMTALESLDDTKGQNHGFLSIDFDHPEAMRIVISEFVEEMPVHILVNNSGGPKGGPIVDADPSEFEIAIRRHVICNQILTQLCIPGMRASDYGRVINIISTSVKEPLPGLGVSNTTRAAVANWAKTMANELAASGITVNNVLPGFTDTERLQEVAQMRAEAAGCSVDEMAEKMKQIVPMQRFGSPEELGAVIAFLASPAASYLTGANIPVDGGRTKSL